MKKTITVPKKLKGKIKSVKIKRKDREIIIKQKKAMT